MTIKIELKADIERLQKQIKELRGELSQTRDLVKVMREHVNVGRAVRPWSAAPGQ